MKDKRLYSYKDNISGARSGIYTPGEVFGELYVYESNGIAQNAADIAKNVVQSGGFNIPGQSLLQFKETPKQFDATDALAVALCHHYQSSSVLSKAGKGLKGWDDFIKKNPERLKK